MKRVSLFGILLIAFLLRVLYLDKFPVGFHADEASNGYDAYSILKTGRDQWGNFMPLVLKSFGDYKSPLYAYLTIPSVAIFGLNKFAVRLPNVILGTAAVLALWLLVGEILKKKNIALVAAFLLAVSPWHIMMSRGAFEANLITFFLPLGVYLYLTKRETLASIVLGLNLFSYHSSKLITPIVFLGLLFLTKRKKLFPMIVFSAFFLLMLYTFKLGGGTRVLERSIFRGALEEGAKVKIELIQKGMNPILARILHNKYQVTVKRFLANYNQYFSAKFLFVDGAAEATYGMIPGVGVIYIFEGILLLGNIFLIFSKKWRFLVLMLMFWLLISPLPAALATGVGYSGNRGEGMIPVFQILEALGLLGFSLCIRKMNKKFVAVIAGAFLIFSILEIGNFIKIYFGEPLKISQQGMLYGNLETASWLSKEFNGASVIVSRSFSEPQIFVAFANKWDSGDFQKETKNWKLETWVDQIPSYGLGNYTFKSIDWKVDGVKKETFLVSHPEEFPKNLIPDKVFYYLDETPSIYVKTN